VLGIVGEANGLTHFDFESSPGDSYHLLFLTKDVLKYIAGFGT
jgi:hypothetical protein